MSTGDHLTIRDYFDRVYTGNQGARKVFPPSRGSETAPAAGLFCRVLASRQAPGIRNANLKSTGLTIADYLANPFGVMKGRYQLSLRNLSPEAKANETPGRQNLPAAKASSGKDTPLSPLRPPVVMPSPKKSASSERQKIEDSVQQAARKYDLPPGLIKGVIRAESNFRINAVSPAGAQGLMQLMPATAKELGVTKPFDINQNIDGGSRYLRKMLDSFGGDVKLALAAYNAGPGTVRKYDGDVPYPETIQYIDRVLRFSAQTV
jgi:soluble lytic murein transglycosylase-like protein